MNTSAKGVEGSSGVLTVDASISFFDNELVNESIRLVVAFFFIAEPDCRDNDDSMGFLDSELLKDFMWLLSASTFSAELNCGDIDDSRRCLDDERLGRSIRPEVDLNPVDGLYCVDTDDSIPLDSLDHELIK